MDTPGGSAGKMRQGARGVPKVKSGCKTCKTRRKKCDEKKPACSRCVQAGWKCDFLLIPSHEHTTRSACMIGAVEASNPLSLQHRAVLPWEESVHGDFPRVMSTLPSHLRNLNWLQAGLFDYFQAVCAPEFSLYFQSNIWEGLILQIVYSEPWALKAALSISTLSRNHYTPEQMNFVPASPFEYAMVCYSQAIITLNGILETSTNGSYLAVIGVILFVTIEFLQKIPVPAYHPQGRIVRNHVHTHIQGGLAILRHGQPRQDLEYLREALGLLQYQEQQFNSFEIANQ
ncbi:hypothetical protein BKA59DRAFT_278111 [Fusarium tricinctum]|uniref:Zn(2)-C6 fungal-type domain-containing protein n=1 Tax=Fusarium tricinctum TaxID=61284 RepID=A0A8K0W750_9HYPO|nr:hypothetical protein BKA59DRAFT_278111 [Fusarium tricinctum]